MMIVLLATWVMVATAVLQMQSLLFCAAQELLVCILILICVWNGFSSWDGRWYYFHLLSQILFYYISYFHFMLAAEEECLISFSLSLRARQRLCVFLNALHQNNSLFLQPFCPEALASTMSSIPKEMMPVGILPRMGWIARSSAGEIPGFAFR